MNAVGLPVGWEPGTVDWQNDTVTYSRDETHHIKPFVKKHSHFAKKKTKEAGA
jgi:hypothetical protein